MKRILEILVTSIVVVGVFLFQSGWRKDYPNIMILHPDKTVSEVLCKSGSGVITCKHSDLYLLQIPPPK